jgi:hypothetical protein
VAESPGHKFGQIIGEILEGVVRPLLQSFADDHHLFLDVKGDRPGVRSGKKLTWKDDYGNAHDLDFVLERHGTQTKLGVPVAIVECAWRSYTKHSKAKAQEIQGAVLPLAEKHRHDKPFLGAILAGPFTASALEQLRSLGFKVLYLSHASVLEAFGRVGIDAAFDDTTSDEEIQGKLAAWHRLDPERQRSVGKELLRLNESLVHAFLDALRETVERRIEKIVVTPLHGNEHEAAGVQGALGFLGTYPEAAGSGAFVAYRLLVTYSNGDRIEEEFKARGPAMTFLGLCLANQAPEKPRPGR